MKFIEVSASGEWNSEKENYDFEPVNNPTYFNASRIEWFDINHDDMSVCFGVIGYQTVFLATASSSVSWFISMKNAAGMIQKGANRYDCKSGNNRLQSTETARIRRL